VVGRVADAGMFSVVNIHWDGGWIDSGSKEKFPETYATFTLAADTKFWSYCEQIARYFEGEEREADLRGAQ